MAKRLKIMKYEPTMSYKLLYEEYKDGYHIAIVSYGTHPCAYISVPKSHPYYGLDYDNIPIDCHGGITFSEPNTKLIKWNKSFMDEDIWWLGWDYAHCCDYNGAWILTGLSDYSDILATKWETNLILNECYEVLEQLKKAEKENGNKQEHITLLNKK